MAYFFLTPKRPKWYDKWKNGHLPWARCQKKWIFFPHSHIASQPPPPLPEINQTVINTFLHHLPCISTPLSKWCHCIWQREIFSMNRHVMAWFISNTDAVPIQRCVVSISINSVCLRISKFRCIRAYILELDWKSNLTQMIITMDNELTATGSSDMAWCQPPFSFVTVGFLSLVAIFLSI